MLGSSPAVFGVKKKEQKNRWLPVIVFRFGAKQMSAQQKVASLDDALRVLVCAGE